jgi:hypothetical protein
MRGNPDNLRQAAAHNSAVAEARAGRGPREMIRRNEPITFRGLAKTSGVWLDFLYRSDLRSTVAGRSRHMDHVNVQLTGFPASQNNENA